VGELARILSRFWVNSETWIATIGSGGVDAERAYRCGNAPKIIVAQRLNINS
jgi:hypothetical protein